MRKHVISFLGIALSHRQYFVSLKKEMTFAKNILQMLFNSESAVIYHCNWFYTSTFEREKNDPKLSGLRAI